MYTEISMPEVSIEKGLAIFASFFDLVSIQE